MTARPIAIAAALAAAAAAASLAAAKGAATYADPGGDSMYAPDVTAVTLSNDDRGRVTVRVDLANRSTTWQRDDKIELALDADANDETGSPTGGIDYLISARPPGPDSLGSTLWGVWKWNGANFSLIADQSEQFFAQLPDKVGIGAAGPGTFGLSFPRALFGVTRLLDFEVGTSQGTGVFDFAPDLGQPSYAYRLDLGPPVVHARPSTGKRGAPVRLRYTVSDDSGRSRERVTILRRGLFIGTASGKPSRAVAGKPRSIAWRAPKRLKPGIYRFCVTAADAAGNIAKASCSRLTLT